MRNILDKRGESKFVSWAIVGLFVIAAFWAYNTYMTPAPAPDTSTGGTGTGTTADNYQYTASYSAVDKFGTTSVAGTSYYKVDGQRADSTAATNVNSGVKYQYWVSNSSSWYVEPKEFTAGKGANKVAAVAYNNASTGTNLVLYDTTNHQTVTSGAANTSIGANGIANIELTYTGVAKKSAAPFGGIGVVEYNSTMTSVTVSGSPVVSSLKDFLGNAVIPQLTYSPTTAGHVYKTFIFDNTLDDGNGLSKVLNIQFQAGSTDIVSAVLGSDYRVKLYPANYYLTNDGEFALDVQKTLNQDNTLTGLSSNVVVGYFS